MTQKSEDLMMGAPATVSLKQLRELNIRVGRSRSRGRAGLERIWQSI